MKAFLGILSLVAPGASVCADLKIERCVAYAQFDEREVHLDWFRADKEEILPEIVLIHGGGWIGDSREAFEPIASRGKE